MTEEQFQDFLNNRYEGQLRWLSKKSATNKKLHQSTSAFAITLTVAAPTLAALGVTRWVVIVVTTALGVMRGLQGLLKFGDLWTMYRATAEALKREKSYYNAALRDYKNLDDDDRRSVFVDRIEEILAQENAAWIEAQNLKTALFLGSQLGRRSR